MAEFEKVDTGDATDTIRRDRYGRYLLPDPETGREQAWTRVTTIAGTLKDRFGLEQWDQRNIVYGMGQKQELYTLAASATLDDRDLLTKIASRAKEAASAKAGADIGSALHTFTERIDRGEDVSVPPPYDLDIDAYRRACEVGLLRTYGDWIERVVIIPEIGAVGTLDRLVTTPRWGLPRIGDIKTATDKVYNGQVTNTVLTYGMVDIPLQLAMYAHASHWWDGKQWQECPEIDQSKAMVMHIPAGLGECRIYEVDIEAGWEAVELALRTRTWRKRKGLAQVVLSIDGSEVPHETGRNPIEEGQASSQNGKAGKGGEAFSTPSADDPPASGPSSIELCHECTIDDPAPWCDCRPTTDDGERFQCFPGPCRQRAHHPSRCPRLDWLRQRVENIKAHDEARSRLAALWSRHDDIPTFPKGGPRTGIELSIVVGMCGLVEMEFSLPFPDPDPGEPELNIKEQKAAWASEDPF